MMKALIFAAGLGERMRPLTLTTPKPLLSVGGKPLIAWHIERLHAIGVRDIVINTSWLADRFPEILGDGSDFGLRLHYSYEGETPLETGGGMLAALPMLGESPFIVINGDIWSTHPLATLPDEPAGLAHGVLIPLPAFRTPGDFETLASGCIRSPVSAYIGQNCCATGVPASSRSHHCWSRRHVLASIRRNHIRATGKTSAHRRGFRRSMPE